MQWPAKHVWHVNECNADYLWNRYDAHRNAVVFEETAKWNTGIIDFRSMPEWRPPIFALLCAIMFGALLKYMLRPFSPDCNTYIFVLIQAATVCVSYWRREIGFFCASVENNKYGVCYDVIIRASEFMTFWAKLPFENGATRLSWDSSGTALTNIKTLPHFRMTDLSRMKTQPKSVSVTQMERAWARVLGEPGWRGEGRRRGGISVRVRCAIKKGAWKRTIR